MKFLIIILLSLSTAYINAQTIIESRSQSRSIMRERLCGVCHIPPGVKSALKIFDLNNINWSKTMSNDQLRQIKWRVKVKGEELIEQRGDPKKHTFTQTEIDILSDFVDLELKNRDPMRLLLGN